MVLIGNKLYADGVIDFGHPDFPEKIANLAEKTEKKQNGKKVEVPCKSCGYMNLEGEWCDECGYDQGE